jgi:hypothetical protein
MINIVRQNRGRSKTRFGILLSKLKPRHQRILMKNEVIRKNSNDDRFLNCLFQIEDAKINISYNNRPFVNLGTREVSTYASVKDSYKILDWECGFCKTKIKSRVDNFDSSNFTCAKCYKYYIKNSSTISQIVIDSMVEFGNYYKGLLLETQKKFIKYIKRNEKRNSLL